MAPFRKHHLHGSLKSSTTTNIHYSKQQQKLHPGAITDFVWKDYSSELFRDIHELRDIRFEEYMSAICCHEILIKLIMSRGSDRPFYCFSHDKRFIIKTMHKSEAKVLIEMLPSYYEYIKKQQTSLLSKYCGLHAARPASGGAKVYFVVMENVLRTELYLDMKYDLKGTSKGRTPSQLELEPGSTVLKDSDLHFRFYLDPRTHTQLFEQIRRDCQFLEEHGLMDYSLLVGMHIESQAPENGGHSPETCLRRDLTLADLAPGCTSRLDSELAARAIRIPQGGTGSMSRGRKPIVDESPMKVYLFLGIVDILQNYNVIKRIEHICKSLHHDPKEISCVKPHLYSTRLQDYLSKVFLPEED